MVTNSHPLTIGIAGAGIMGRALAWRLCQLGHSITLFDRDPIEDGDAAAYTAAGMLTPYSEVESAELTVFQMGMKSLDLWPEIIASLDEPVAFNQRGSLILAHGNDRPDHLRFNQQVLHKLTPTEQQFQQLNRSQIQELEPELADHFAESTYLPEEAWVSSEEVMAALAKQLLNRGVTWHQETTVTNVGNHVIQTEEQSHEFDLVVDCRGLGAKPDLSELRGVRGEVIRVQAPDVNISRLVRLMHPRYRLYIIPRPDNVYIIGATQIESDDMGPITVRSGLELLSALYSVHPGFAEARVIDIKTNCRPALKDNLPRIQVESGCLRVNGLYRHGYLLAPVVADEAVRYLTAPKTYQSEFVDLIRTV